MQDNDYEHHVRTNVFRFMHEKLGVPKDDCYEIWKREFSKYNQSLKGLREYGFKFDVEEYWDFIRQGAEDFLTADPEVTNPPQHPMPHTQTITAIFKPDYTLFVTA